MTFRAIGDEAGGERTDSIDMGRATTDKEGRFVKPSNLSSRRFIERFEVACSHDDYRSKVSALSPPGLQAKGSPEVFLRLRLFLVPAEHVAADE